MSVLTKRIEIRELAKATTRSRSKPSLWNRYLAYADRQEKSRILWLILLVLFIPNAVMAPAIFLMGIATINYVWFIGFCMALFFVNMTLFIAEAKGRLFVPIFHFTVALMLLIPLIIYLQTL